MPAKQPWVDRHMAKWERIVGTVPGLQMIHVDSKHFEIRISLPGLEECFTIARPARKYVIPPTEAERQRAVNLRLQPPQAREVVEPEVDVSDDDIDRVLAYWAQGKSAAEVFGVNKVFKPSPAPVGAGWAAM